MRLLIALIILVVVALLLTAFIVRVALQILRRSMMHLTDTVAVPAEQIGELALSVDGVAGVHKIRSRMGPGGGHADLHVQVRPDLRLDEAHEIGHRVADRLREELNLTDVITHVEPPVGHRVAEDPDRG